MQLLLIPLIPFLSALFLLDFQYRDTRAWFSKYVSLVSAAFSLLLVLNLALFDRLSIPYEYQLNQLFLLPRTSEALSFSLLADSISLRWLILLTVFSFMINLLAFKTPSNQKPVDYAVHQMILAGLAFFFLSGSLISGAIGWGITLSAILLMTTNIERSSSNRQSSGFTTLMISVFLMMSASLLLYALTGRLSYSVFPDSLSLIVRSLIGTPPVAAVLNTVFLACFFLLLAVIPGLGLIPFSSWLSDTREMNIFNALFIYVMILPSNVIVLERYQWLFQFVPGIKYIALAIAILSICISFMAVFSQKGGKLTMLWLAVTCSGMLMGVVFIPEFIPVSTFLLILYPSLFVFGLGRLLDFQFHIRWGRYIQTLGIILPFLSVIILSQFNRTNFHPLLLSIVLSLYAIPAFRIFRFSRSEMSDDPAFSSSLGWLAYSFFGTHKIIYYGIAWPIQQIADGFLILESGWNFFLTHTIPRLLCTWGRLLWLFDQSFMGRQHQQPTPTRNEKTIVKE